MLIDQLLSDPIVAKSGLMTADLRGRMSKATKSTARRDFAMAADELSNSIDNVNRALPFARLLQRMLVRGGAGRSQVICRCSPGRG